jgi:2-haloacid dehalogenase
MKLKALTFDIIGTVFDVYDGLAKGVGPLNAKYRINVPGGAFAQGSLNGYATGVEAVLGGGEWTPPDTILRAATQDNLPIQQLGPRAPQAITDFLNLWHALPPWPDVAAGMHALHKHCRLAVLSNMSVATQTALRAHADLPFDQLLSAETVKTYKPTPVVYQMAASRLGVSPDEILMVAAHNFDLSGAKKQGFRTAFVGRPREYGPGGSPGNHPDPSFDFNASSFVDLAEQLGRVLGRHHPD